MTTTPTTQPDDFTPRYFAFAGARYNSHQGKLYSEWFELDQPDDIPGRGATPSHFSWGKDQRRKVVGHVYKLLTMVNDNGNLSVRFGHTAERLGQLADDGLSQAWQIASRAAEVEHERARREAKLCRDGRDLSLNDDLDAWRRAYRQARTATAKAVIEVELLRQLRK